MEKEVKNKNNIKVGILVLTTAYDMFGSFRDSRVKWCHEHTHRLGYVIYDNLYIDIQDLPNISANFLYNSTMCGSGMFHGFIEHLIQNNPDNEFVIKTCDLFQYSLGRQIPKIDVICYHASGHGFVLAQTEKIQEESWGDFHRFVDEPLTKCTKFQKEEYVRECQAGVFNIVSSFMWYKNYDFYTNYENMSTNCSDFTSEELSQLCYAKILDPVLTNSNITSLTDLLDTVTSLTKNELTQGHLLKRGIIKNILSSSNDEKKRARSKSLAFCESLEQSFYRSCIKGILYTFYLQEKPGEEINNMYAFCDKPVITQKKEEHEFCLQESSNLAGYIYK